MWVVFSFYLDADKGNITCIARGRYGDMECDVTDWLESGIPKAAYRDAYREQEILQTVQHYFPSIDMEQQIFHCDKDEDTIYRVLEQGVDVLMQLGEVNSTERFRNLKIRRHAKVSVGVSVEVHSA